MRAFGTWILLALACYGPVAGHAQLQLVPDKAAQQVFGGATRKIALVWSNAGEAIATADLRAQLLQASSATVMVISETAWKRLSVLPGQTVCETAGLDFPAVKAETRFIIRWENAANQLVGVTDVLAYPTNLMAELRVLAGVYPLAVFDPEDQLKPLLKSAGVDFVDLENGSLAGFNGRLAIFGPFAVWSQMRAGAVEQMQALAKKDVAVVWLQAPPAKPPGKFQPSFYSVPAGRAAVVVAQPELVADLAENPEVQRNLIRLSELALHPEPVQLPLLTGQP